MTIGTSAGTASLMGLNKIKIDTPTTTAYFMIGERCANNCLFCSKGRHNSPHGNFLSRIAWPQYPRIKVFGLLDNCYKNGDLKRACLQVLQTPDSLMDTKQILKEIKERSQIPVCTSIQIDEVEEASLLLNAGADRVCIALDAVTPKIFKEMKDKDFKKRLDVIDGCAKKYPGRITTHIIVGLGETEYDMISRIEWLLERQVTTAIFAFTPLEGTPLAKRSRPDIGMYRRVQVTNYLLSIGMITFENLHFSQNRLIDIDLGDENWRDIVLNSGGVAFQTSGCPDCNRPYYNERPGGVMYNYPRPLSPSEVMEAINQCELEGYEPKGMRSIE